MTAPRPITASPTPLEPSTGPLTSALVAASDSSLSPSSSPDAAPTSSASSASAMARRSRAQQQRIRRAGLWSLLLPALLQHSVTVHTKRGQHIRGTLTHLTLDLNLTLSRATSHYPALTRTKPDGSASPVAAERVAVVGGGRRNVRVGDVWLSESGREVWDEVVVSVRHIQSVVPPVGFQLQAAMERKERKRQQGQRLYARRKLNANKVGVG